MALSKLSLSKNKAAKRHQSDTPGASAPYPVFSAGQSARASAPSVLKAANPPAKSNPTSRQPSFLRALDDDSDWDSDHSEPSKGSAAQGHGATLATGPRQGAACAAMPAPPGFWAVPAQQPQSEIYDLDDEDEERRPNAIPACSGAAAGLAQVRAEQVEHSAAPASQPQPPHQQSVHHQQPQHRKRSFDQEEVEPAAADPSCAAPGLRKPPTTTQPVREGDGERSKLSSQPSSGSLPGSGGDASSADPPDPPKYQAVKAWLQGLQLEQHYRVFVREEIDMTVVHTLTADDLASIGITQRHQQQAIISAGREVGAARQHAQRRQAHGAGAGGAAAPAPARPKRLAHMPVLAKPAQAPSHAQQQGVSTAQQAQRAGWGMLQPQWQQQQATAGAPPTQKARPAAVGRGSHQSLLQVWQANSAAQVAASAATGSEPQGSAGSDADVPRGPLTLVSGSEASACQLGADVDDAQHASLAHAGTRPKERALLAQLYPAHIPPAAAVRGQRAPATGAARVLRPSTAGGAGRVPAGASLWVAAGECRQVTPGMEERLNKRRAEAGLDSAPREVLARGGTAYPQADESRALKVLKLQALRQELAMHEETVAGLRRMIATVETDLGL